MVHKSAESSLAQVEVKLFEADQVALDSFNEVFGRQKHVMRIVGDIVNRDPELWNCERE